jgi:heme/copper-type cytochrome/quinol oxidase subunit 2
LNMITSLPSTETSKTSTLTNYQTSKSSTSYDTETKVQAENQFNFISAFYIIIALLIVLTSLLMILVYAFVNHKNKSNKSKVAPIDNNENFKIEESTI